MLKKFISGCIVGACLMLGTTVYAEQIKQFILTPVTYPIVVDGVEYKDAERPVLNYEGSTYVPLAKLGDITGVDYVWNDQLGRVEINTGKGRFYSEYNGDIPNYASVNGISSGKRIELSDGKTVMYAYDVTDATDGNIQKYVNELEKQGYVYESDTSDDEVSYYSKGDIFVALTVMGYDFNVIISKE